MAFGEDLRLFADKVHRRSRAVFIGSVTTVHESITDGSPVTGAPGQPVDTGFLKGSWQVAFPDMWIGEVATNVSYAPVIEEGYDRTEFDPSGVDRPADMVSTRQGGRSPVGGPHSVKLTRLAWDRIVQHEVNKATSTGG